MTLIAGVEFAAIGQGAAVMHVDCVAGLGFAGAGDGFGCFDVKGRGGEGEGSQEG